MKAGLSFACAVLAMSALPCLAAGSSWDGTWKLNEAKSNLAGETYVMEDKGNGKMHVIRGAITYDFACDGKPYTVVADYTLTCTGSPAEGYDYVARKRDTVTTKSHRTFSADGKTMTVHGTDFHPDGSTQEFTDTWRREAGTNGLAGKWRNVKSEGQSDVIVIETKGDWIKVYDSTFKSTMEGKMDGSDLAVNGPAEPAGMMHTVTMEGPNKLRYTVKLNGKVTGEGVQTLSADGKTLVDEYWTVGKRNEKSTSVYERQ